MRHDSRRAFKQQFLISLVLLMLVFTGAAYGQEKTCSLALQVVDSDKKGPVNDAYAEAYSSEISETFYASNRDSIHTFDNMSPGYYHFTVQKRGYKVSRYFFKLDCSKESEEKRSIVVPIYAGNIAEQENVTPQEAVAKNQPPRTTGKDLSKKDVARTFNLLNFLARKLVPPRYPPAARAVKATGTVLVHVLVNEVGEIESAEVVSGHPLLRGAAREAAEKAKFDPVLVNGKPIKRQGFLVYNFVF